MSGQPTRLASLTDSDGAAQKGHATVPMWRDLVVCVNLGVLDAICFAWFLCLMSGRSLMKSVAALLAVMLLVVIVPLWRSARRIPWPRAAGPQFSLAGMLLATVILAALLGLMRWFVEGSWDSQGPDKAGTPLAIRWIAVTVSLLFLGFLWLPVVLWLNQSLTRRRQLEMPAGSGDNVGRAGESNLR